MSESRSLPSSGSVLATLVGVTWRRLFRGRALWVSALIALLPAILAAVLPKTHDALEGVLVVQFLVLALLPPMFVASSLGEEIEDRTTTYLWSRPIARWTVVVGKLLALAPIAMFLVVAGLVLSRQIAHQQLSAREILAMAGGALAICALAAGLATLVPKYGMALSIVYVVIFDLPLGAIPASLNTISITKQVRLMMFPEGSGLAQPAITMAIIAAIWLALAMWRIRRLES